MGSSRQRFIELCRDVLRPIIEADEGKLYLVAAEQGELYLHLGGTCSGCPGVQMTIRSLIEPAARAIDPNVRLVVTVGAKRPPNAILVQASDSFSNLQSSLDDTRAVPESDDSNPESGESTSPESSNGDQADAPLGR